MLPAHLKRHPILQISWDELKSFPQRLCIFDNMNPIGATGTIKKKNRLIVIKSSYHFSLATEIQIIKGKRCRFLFFLVSVVLNKEIVCILFFTLLWCKNFDIKELTLLIITLRMILDVNQYRRWFQSVWWIAMPPMIEDFLYPFPKSGSLFVHNGRVIHESEFGGLEYVMQIFSRQRTINL